MANTIVLCENNQSMEDENDLEDGEIEDDDDEVIIESETPAKDVTSSPKSDVKNDKKVTVNSDGIISVDLSKNDKDKDSRSSRRERRAADRAERHHHKSRKRTSAETEDDWAGNVEKAIASIIKKEKKPGKTDEELSDEDDSSDEKRRGKKRRRREKERKKKRRKSIEEKVPEIMPPRYPSPPEEEIDEDEMLCIRGGSPKPAPLSLVPQPLIMSPLPFPNDGPFDPNQFDMYDSGSSDYDSDYQDRKRSFERDRDRKRDRDKKREGSKRDRKSKTDKNRERRTDKNRPVLQDANSICLFYMQGKCHKHLESAPKEILGDFPRLSREGAHSLVNATQKKLDHQYNNDGNTTSSSTSGIPSLFDINVSIPKELVSNLNDQENKLNDGNHKGATKSPRSRPSRWGSEKEQVDVSQLVAQMNQQQSNYNNVPQSVFDNLNAQDQQKIQMYNMSFKFPGFYSDKGDQDMRIVSNGDVDMRALPPTLPKPISVDSDSQNNDTESPPSPDTSNEHKVRDNIEKTEEEKALTDQDMRLLPALLPTAMPTVTNENNSPSTMKNYVQAENHLESDNGLEEERDLEIDEPPEDESLKIDMNEDDEPENSSIKQEKNETDDLPSNLPLKQRELFMRIKAQQKENLFKEEKNESDDDVGQDENWYSDEDDEENSAPLSNILKNLGHKDSSETKKSEQKDLKDVDLRPAEIKPGVIEPLTLQSGSNLMNKLSELSKVDISAEVTKLLSLVKNQTNQSLHQSTNSTTTNTSTTTTITSSMDPRSQSSRDPRDPRHQSSSNTEKSTESKTSSSSSVNNDPRMKRKSSSDSRESSTKVHPKISIYELGTIDRSSSPTENRGDTDLRSLSDMRMRDSDLRVSNFGDTDLRPGGRSDVDLRQLNLPFKPIENYVPATEIEASISSHPPIPYRVHVCYIPRPDYTGLKLSAKDAQSSADPRIRKIFRISTTPKMINEIASPEPSTPASPPSSSQNIKPNPNILSPKSSDPRRADPRMQRKLSNTSEPKEISQSQQQQQTTSSGIPLEQMALINGTSLDYNQQMQLLQSSTFYQGLNSNQKLILNQAIASQKSEQNSLQNDPILAAVLANLGLTNNPLNTNSLLNPALGLMSLLNLSSNLNTPLVQPSLLGPGPTPLMATNLGPLGPSNDFNMGGFGVPGNQGTGLLGHSPYQNNMSGPSGNDFQFNNEQFFGGMEFGNNGGNKRNDRGYRGDRPNRRGRGGGGNWNNGSGGRHGGNNRGNFQSRSARSNNRTNNRSRTPP